jgi:serine/threonine protein kinase
VTQEVCAAKELNDERQEACFSRLEILGHLDHPNVVGLVGYYLPDESQHLPFTILTEWIPNGSLDARIDNPKAPSLDSTQKVIIVVGIVLGMRYVHASGVIHADLKPGSVLMNRNFEAKIGDFGSATLSDLRETMTKEVGTAAYMAPEMIDGVEYGCPVDVYSFGIMLWEFVTGVAAFKDIKASNANARQIKLFREVCDGKRPDTKGIFAPMAQLMQQCWKRPPEERPTFDQLFNGLRDRRYEILPGVKREVVEEYVKDVLEYEKAHPAKRFI